LIPVNETLLGTREKDLLNECIDTGWISSDGPFVSRFEKEFASFCDSKYGIAVSNGTAALEVALFALGIKPGDEVILPTFTIISCAIAIIRLGAIPVLVDIEPDTWCMDVTKIEQKITPKTKAIMVVHIYGHPVDMDPVLDLARKKNILVLEDGAEAHGAKYKERIVGSLGDISAFSFYANKIITTGEGGMVVTSNEEFFKKAASYRNLCFIPSKRFLHEELGYNFRMSNLQAAVGVAQLERINSIIQRKVEIGKYYEERLNQISGVRFQKEKPWAKTVYWMYSIELDKNRGKTAESVMQKLAQREIGTRPFFLGLHRQPALLKMGFTFGNDYPNSDYASEYGLYLPSGNAITEQQVDIVCNNLKLVLEEN